MNDMIQNSIGWSNETKLALQREGRLIGTYPRAILAPDPYSPRIDRNVCVEKLPYIPEPNAL